MLVSDPHEHYADWESWDHFFDSYYKTLDEMSKVAQNLGITTQAEYYARYTEDPKLTCTPNRRFSKDWENWETFLGKRKKQFYPILRQAGRAAKKLGIKTQKEYKERYKEDDRLPMNPDQYYPYQEDWENWTEFLGTSFYPNLEEASKAAKKLGVRSRRKYEALYKKDSKLPCNPKSAYKEQWNREGWTWDKFFGRE